MAEIIIIRLNFISDNRKLRRARRLYSRLIRGFVKNNPDSLVFFAHKAVNRGLYSKNTALRDVGFSMITHFYKLDSGYLCEGYRYEWHDYMRQFSPFKIKGLYKPNTKFHIKMGINYARNKI